MALPALAIPIIMTGTRAVIKRAPDIARKLIKAGKARYAKNVSRDIDEAVTKVAGKGKGAPKLDLPGAARRKAQRELKAKVEKNKGTYLKREHKPFQESGKKPAGKKYTWTAKGKKATGTTTPKKAAAPTAGVTRAAQVRKATGTAAPKSGTKTGTSTAQARLRRATGTAAPTGGVTRAAQLRKATGTAAPTGGVTRAAQLRKATAGTSKMKRPSGLRAAGVIAGTVGAASLLDPSKGGTKSVTVKSGDTLSQIAKDNNTTIAAIKKANPSITNIHLITPGQKIKVPKVKGRKSVYQGMTAEELKQSKKTASATSKPKFGPGGFGASKTGGIIKRSTGGKVKKYGGGGTLKGTKQITNIGVNKPPVKKNPWGAAIKGRGKGYK